MRAEPIVVALVSVLVACASDEVETDAGAPDAASLDAAPGAPGDAGEPLDPDDPFAGPLALDDDAVAALDPAQLFAASTPCRAPALVRVDLAVDGDTLGVTRMSDGATERVRLLSVNTPEIAHSPLDSDQCYGPEAHRYTRQLVGHLVWLTFDLLCTDPYDRTLAFVHAGAGPVGIWERRLVRRGFGRAYLVGRNRAIATDIMADEAAARASRAGLWGACP